MSNETMHFFFPLKIIRLKHTVIENKLIKQYDRENAFIYCDPPYYQTEGHYAVEFRKEDHYRLRDTLAFCKRKWLVFIKPLLLRLEFKHRFSDFLAVH